MNSGSAEDGITALTYEAALAELDTLISKLEGGSIALEEAIGAYERGVILAQHCSDLLAHTEHRVAPSASVPSRRPGPMCPSCAPRRSPWSPRGSRIPESTRTTSLSDCANTHKCGIDGSHDSGVPGAAR
jgi:exodeoxyribonuclease VII small subunit